jgi:hypothetical protein
LHRRMYAATHIPDFRRMAEALVLDPEKPQTFRTRRSNQAC